MGKRDEESKGKAGKERHDYDFFVPKERDSLVLRRNVLTKILEILLRAVRDSRIRARLEVVASERKRAREEGRDLFLLPR